ncbi:TMEM165/GDT1 family protein [Mastigocladopsis repens]|uniref:TMEM165/GDT1 family protein n=1 Tax=Mastigocladopsis repens TaxID=221287 RepID=UPI0002DD0B19|nr:TMEM165/GDT1 family protein [Mastigocladopsis repens]
MKVDSKPLNLSVSETESKLELKDEVECNSTTTLVELPSALVSDKPQKPQTPVVIFATTFLTIFLAEIGDKTQLSTLLMSAESQSPWVVFLGSAAALVTTSLLGVVLGSWIASKLSPKTVEKAAGIMLLLISLMLFWDVAQF